MKTRNKMVAVLAAGASTLALNAHAELPEEATNAFTALKADGEAMIGAAWPVIVAMVGGFLLIKIFKRAAGKL